MVDEALVAKAKLGDADALEALLAAVAPALHRFGLRMCRQRDDADEVLQDALVAIATNLPDLENHASLTSWAFALARTACARRRRGLKHRPLADVDEHPEPVDQGPDPESRAEQGELMGALATALRSLSDEHREVIVLRDIEGLTAPEAADALGMSVDAVKSRLHRARRALHEAMRPVVQPVSETAGPRCPDIIEAWSRKLEGELRRHDCEALEAHLSGCTRCGTICDALKQELGACARSRSRTVVPEEKARVAAALQTWRQMRDKTAQSNV